MRRPPPDSALFPYTTLFRSLHHELGEVHAERVGAVVEVAEADGLVLRLVQVAEIAERREGVRLDVAEEVRHRDRKSTRLNSTHVNLVCRLLLEKKNVSVLIF